MVFVLVLLLLQAQNFFSVEQSSFSMPEDSLISTQWTVEDGLPVNSINEIVQDSTGYLWITTYDGIVRFDGLEFSIYTHSTTPTIPQNRAVYLLPQSGNKLWITLENGGVLLKEGEDTFTHYNEDDGFTSSNVTDMIIDSQGAPLFASLDGVHRYRDGKFRTVYTKDTNLESQVNYIYKDGDNSMWFATADGLVHYQDDNQQKYHLPAGTGDHYIRRIHRTADGQLLLSGERGLFTFSNEEITQPSWFSPVSESFIHLFVHTTEGETFIASTNGLYKYGAENLTLIPGNQDPTSPFIFFFEDSDDQIWLVNDNGDVYLLKNDQLTAFQFPDGASYHVNKIMKDREENLWFTTGVSGLIRVKKSEVKTITTANGLSGNNILGMFESKNSDYWIGTRDEGLNHISGNTIKRYFENTPPLRNVVQSINQDPDGNIWVGYLNSGLVKFDADTDSYSAYQIGQTDQINDIRSIFFRCDSSMWLGTYGGLVKFDPVNQDHTFYTEDDGLGSNLIRYIDEDKNGALWLATVQQGMSRFKDGEFTNYTVQDGLASNNIRSVYVDELEEGTIWVGTETNGISRIRDGEIRSLGTRDGLPDHVIHYISQDTLGNLWMSSNRGIFKINKDRLNAYLDETSESFDLIHFDKSDGMLNPEANGTFQSGGLRTTDNDFWFSTQEGVAIFPIEPNHKNTSSPTVIFKELFSDGEAQRISKNSRIELATGKDDFNITFHALTFTSPEKTKFRYRLRGHQDEWTEVYNERTAMFFDLPAGNYTFQLLAANNHGVWSSEPAEVTIVVSDYFYNQWWFLPLLLVLFIAGLVPASRLRYRYMVRNQQKMENLIDRQTSQIQKEKNALERKNKIIEQQSEKLRELNETKDKFFSIIAHDLRNPFQAILGFTEILAEGAKELENEDIKSHVEQIDIASQRVFSLLENLLKWSSLQTGSMKPNQSIHNIENIVFRVKRLLEHQAMQKNIKIHTDVPSHLTGFVDSNMLQIILQNLVSNAIKFSDENGKVDLIVRESEEKIRISVIDKGIGIPEELLKNLMKLDTNSSRLGTSDEKGSGLGLIISKEMTEIQNGSLTVESTVGEGTTFTVLFPKKPITEV